MTYRISKELFEAVRNHKINKINIYGSSKYFYIFDDYLPDHSKVGREESYNDFCLSEFGIKVGDLVDEANNVKMLKSQVGTLAQNGVKTSTLVIL